MSATKYTKYISTDFIGLTELLPNINALTSEIQGSSIIIALDFINMSGNDVDVWFKAPISASDPDDVSALNAIVAAHTGVPLPDESVQNVNIESQSEGCSIKSSPVGFQDLTGYNVYRKGYKFTVTADSTYEHEISYTSDMMLQGLAYKLDSNPHEDDYMEVEIVDVDGIVYPADTILVTFASTLYVTPDEVFKCLCDDAKQLYSWAYIRVRYVSNGTSDVVVRLQHLLRTMP